jgi:DNA-binding NarL/FixJ family response regulator
MDNGTRILVASGLAHTTIPALTPAFDGTVIAATTHAEIQRAVQNRVRFDVVVTDLTWIGSEGEFSLDAFDVLDELREQRRTAPVVIAAQGFGVERDYLDELPSYAEVMGVYRKSTSPDALVRAVQMAAHGRHLPRRDYPWGARSDGTSIHSYFSNGRRGATAARMAGAIASGRASDARTLQAATNIPLNTVNKLVAYLGPLILSRREHPQELPLTAPSVYRWCGEHSRYLLSWCRRHMGSPVCERVIAG